MAAKDHASQHTWTFIVTGFLITHIHPYTINATQYFNAPFTHPCWEVMLTAHLFELTKLLFSCTVILVLAFFFLSSHFWILPHC